MDNTPKTTPKRGPYIREVNAIHSTFAKELSLRATNCVRFLEEIFLVANVSPEVVLGIPFLTLSGKTLIS